MGHTYVNVCSCCQVEYAIITYTSGTCCTMAYVHARFIDMYRNVCMLAPICIQVYVGVRGYTYVCVGMWVCVCVCVCVVMYVCVCGRGECIAEHIHTHCVWMNVCVEEVGVATYSAVDDEGGSEGDEVSYDIGVC